MREREKVSALVLEKWRKGEVEGGREGGREGCTYLETSVVTLPEEQEGRRLANGW